MTTAIIVQARMTSTRLPGKVMAEVRGKPLLEWQLRRLMRSRSADSVIVATTSNPADAAITEVAGRLGLRAFRGPEHDVMARFILAASIFGVDTIVRSTADCPLIDARFVDGALDRFAYGEADYLAPIGLPDGMGCEVIRIATLEDAYAVATSEEREHVTLHVRRHPERYRLMDQPTGLGLDEARWTVDTAADLAMVTRLIEAVADPITATLEDFRRLLTEHPEWSALNASIPMGPVDREMLTRRRNFMPALGDL